MDQVMTLLFQVLVVCAVVEAVVQIGVRVTATLVQWRTLKQTPEGYEELRVALLQGVSALVGVVATIMFRMGLLQVVGVEAAANAPMLDYVLTGLMFGRGASGIHKLLKPFGDVGELVITE